MCVSHRLGQTRKIKSRDTRVTNIARAPLPISRVDRCLQNPKGCKTSVQSSFSQQPYSSHSLPRPDSHQSATGLERIPTHANSKKFNSSNSDSLRWSTPTQSLSPRLRLKICLAGSHARSQSFSRAHDPLAYPTPTIPEAENTRAPNGKQAWSAVSTSEREEGKSAGHIKGLGRGFQVDRFWVVGGPKTKSAEREGVCGNWRCGGVVDGGILRY
ncbi:hypothetical protein BU26DRAFT_257373 [Trematosphaeria pertusa]|uniref:Uncharacterized protein n=1 Tax=Trematosphaeria pertusa TaxID=390896 RepID=A0A6A6IPX6_9PLEO|nr:uncharacterized protein BU26DRAFT_257373 [Trematosphaeria pertusa]KAF2252456.1 hypothetical protein BU26DRAFT_257373 [Trematosphaeria pertusa]